MNKELVEQRKKEAENIFCISINFKMKDKSNYTWSSLNWEQIKHRFDEYIECVDAFGKKVHETEAFADYIIKDELQNAWDWINTKPFIMVGYEIYNVSEIIKCYPRLSTVEEIEAIKKAGH